MLSPDVKKIKKVKKGDCIKNPDMVLYGRFQRENRKAKTKMSNNTEIVKIENAIGRELTDAEFWNVGERIYNALCNGGRNEAESEVEAIISELKAA